MAEKYFLLSEIEKDFDWLKSRGSEDIQFRELIERLENGVIPAADVAPVVHGRWVKPVPGDGENYCSVCKAEQPWFYGYGYFEPDYCPNCGARMDGKEPDNEVSKS